MRNGIFSYIIQKAYKALLFLKPVPGISSHFELVQRVPSRCDRVVTAVNWLSALFRVTTLA